MWDSSRLQTVGTSQQDVRGTEGQRRQRRGQMDCGGRSSTDGHLSESSRRPPKSCGSEWFGDMRHDGEKTVQRRSIQTKTEENKRKTEFNVQANLLCDAWIWPQLEQASCKASRRLEVTQFEEQVQSCTQNQHHVDWLEIAVGEVSSHLRGETRKCKETRGNCNHPVSQWQQLWQCQQADIYLTQPLLLFQRVFRQLLPFRLHGQTHDVFFADCDQLLSLKHVDMSIKQVTPTLFKTENCIFV